MVPKSKNNIYLVVLILFAIISIIIRNPIFSLLYIVLSVSASVFIIYKQEKEKTLYKNILENYNDEYRNRFENVRNTLIQFLEAIPFPIVYINPRGDFEYLNQNFRVLVPEPVESIYATDFHGPLKRYMLDAFLNETQYVRDLNYQESEYQIYTIPLHKEKRYDGCVVVFQDITQVKDGERIQKRFIADASHELRTPITAIKGMIEILNRDDFSDEKAQKEFLAQIMVESSRLEKIVDDLLLQSRLQANKVYLEISTFNLRQFFEGIILENRQVIHQNGIEMILNCPSDIMITGDHFRLRQVFLNLINNAFNYVPQEGGKIRINCIPKDDRIKIEVIDNGAGMDSEIQKHIFERFFKGDSARRRNQSGSGLGLAISKAIIQAHKGEISVQSKLGEGTKFTVELTQS